MQLFHEKNYKYIWLDFSDGNDELEWKKHREVILQNTKRDFLCTFEPGPINLED